MANNGINIGLKSYDDLFKDDIGRRTEEIKPTPISELKPFSDQPFKVVDDDNMTELVESIKLSGILSPIIARPHPEGGYEILSGHRRVRACEIAGIKEVPVVVKDLDDDTAIILLVDSNLQREHILPSEKAKAYQMKLEAMKRQGERTDLTSDQFGRKSGIESREILAEQVGESKNQISRYVRLTELVDKLKRGVISIQHTLYRVKSEKSNKKTELRISTPKSESAIRDIPLPKFLIAKLSAIEKGSGFLIQKKGKHIEPNVYSRRYKKILQELDIPYRKFHATRHTFATRALEIGMDIKTLSEILGHSSPTVTLNLYSHSLPEHKKKEMDRLGKLYNPSN